jgi:hypothetical protein
MMIGEEVAGNPGEHLELCGRLATVVAGHRFQGTPAVPGEPVQFVREPDNSADANAIAVHDAAGRRLGYLFRELAAEHAGLLDRGIVRLSGRLVAPGEPGHDLDRARINPPLIVQIHVDTGRLGSFLVQIGRADLLAAG